MSSTRGGGGLTEGLIVADWEEIEKSQRPKDVEKKSFPLEDIKIITTRDKHIFPLRDGTRKQSSVIPLSFRPRTEEYKISTDSEEEDDQENDDTDHGTLQNDAEPVQHVPDY